MLGREWLHEIVEGTKAHGLDGTAKRSVIPGTSKVATLEDISVYTSEEQESLKDIFKRMKSNKVNLSGLDLTKAENAAIIKTFETLVPNYDR